MRKFTAFASALLLLPLLSAPRATAQTVNGATKAAPLVVVLLWSPDTVSASPPVGYNVYRKLSTDPGYPGTPLNGGTPVAPMTNCVQFSSIIPSGSPDWVMLSNALPDSGAGGIVPLSDVCSITLLTRGAPKWRRVQTFVAGKISVARVMGQGYIDNTVISGKTYVYQVRRVVTGGAELPADGLNEVTITAGFPAAIPTPTITRVVVGDSKIQLLWQEPDARYQRFDVLRAPIALGPYRKVNDADLSLEIRRDLDSNAVAPPAHGFTDFERWNDSTGEPKARTVPGVPGAFTGPANGKTYYYKIRFKDILDNPGPESSPIVNATPADKTPPMTPQGINVTAVESSSGFQIRWRRVRLNVDAHHEATKGYKIYRYTDPESPAIGATPVLGLILQPGLSDSSVYIVAVDSSAGLRNACGDKTYWYRVEALDSAGNVSTRSAAGGAALKDTTRPASVKGTSAEGFDDFIRVKWQLNTDCDIDQYLIYRALCDYGTWTPCDTTRRGATVTGAQANPKDGDGKKKHDCGGPFVLVGTVPHSVAKAMATPQFDDKTVPPGSPICYAYLVKSQDHSQNICGAFPVPDLSREIVICQRLRDRTPPSAAIIAGMFSRDSAIRVEFIGPPVQDIAAYHLYRATNQAGPYTWAGGVTIVPPPGLGVILTSPYTPLAVSGCDSIPLVSNPYMSAGKIVDRNVDPKLIYWYKVLGIDRNGNETSPDSAVALSTFTFARNRETPPEIASITSADNPCALRLTMTTAFDPTTMMGYIVFRSTAEDGPYTQLEGLVQDNAFNDNSVARNATYWYRVAIMKRSGATTNLSAAKNAVHP